MEKGENKQEVTIMDMMQCRERRVQIQNELIQEFHTPVVSFCMNIPGPVKTDQLIRGDQAQNCARSRKHTIAEMQEQIRKILSCKK